MAISLDRFNFLLWKKKRQKEWQGQPKDPIIVKSGLCPFCGNIPKTEKLKCPKCNIEHCAKCWEDNRFKCSIYGCTGRISKLAPEQPKKAQRFPCPRCNWCILLSPGGWCSICEIRDLRHQMSIFDDTYGSMPGTSYRQFSRESSEELVAIKNSAKLLAITLGTLVGALGGFLSSLF